MVSSMDSNRVGSAELSPKDLRRLLVEIADEVLDRPHSLEYMIGLIGDALPEDVVVFDRMDAVDIAGFGFTASGYRFRVDRVSEIEHSDNPIAATKVYGPKRR